MSISGTVKNFPKTGLISSAKAKSARRKQEKTQSRERGEAILNTVLVDYRLTGKCLFLCFTVSAEKSKAIGTSRLTNVFLICFERAIED